ncbi:hypothetical protein [Vitreoscilla massiliensis]
MNAVDSTGQRNTNPNFYVKRIDMVSIYGAKATMMNQDWK